MKFELPNAAVKMNNKVAEVGDEGDSWEVIGEPLSGLVDKTLPAYDKALDLELAPSAGDKRTELATLRWGKIAKDIARLTGLVDAIRDVSRVVGLGKAELAHDWKGEAYDAFAATITKVETLLDDYATAVETSATGMATALAAIQRFHTVYRDDTLEAHLNFTGVAPPNEWRRMTSGDADFLAEHCTCVGNCFYNDADFLPLMDRKLVTKKLFDQLEKWDCTHNSSVVTGQYRFVVDGATEERTTIKNKIHDWYVATDELEENVGKAFGAALENLRILAEVKVFAGLSVPGAAAPGGGDPGPGGGDPGPGSTGYPGGGGDPGPGSGYPGGGGAEVAVPTEPEPTPEPAPTEPAADSADTADAAVAPDAEPAESADTVQITDGDRKISVTSPDGEGHVKVTVTDAAGTTKSYALDFDAASEMSRPSDTGVGPQGQQVGPDGQPLVEQVPARSDGKCVIQDGEVTITAERPLFAPDSISFTIDAGTGAPTTYTVDFEDAAETPATAAAPSEPVDAAATTVTAEDPAAAPAQPEAEPTANATTAQAWHGDPSGSVSGVLVDNHDGEAGLASAEDSTDSTHADDSADKEANGMAGAGMPMTGGGGGGAGAQEGRAGSGWSVHGDLFEAGTVYSMHGVLGDDELE
jgi:hypothetical protein